MFRAVTCDAFYLFHISHFTFFTFKKRPYVSQNHQSSAFKMSWETFWLGAEKQKAEKQPAKKQTKKKEKTTIIVTIILIITLNI